MIMIVAPVVLFVTVTMKVHRSCLLVSLCNLRTEVYSTLELLLFSDALDKLYVQKMTVTKGTADFHLSPNFDQMVILFGHLRLGTWSV